MVDSHLGRFIAKPAPIHSLTIADLFSRLEDGEKLYAHHMSRASWHGTRIVLRQTSPEAIAIFDWIISLHGQCYGHWKRLSRDLAIDETEMNAFLDYAACFLSNVGNYYGSGNQKFIPCVSTLTLAKLCGTYMPDSVKAAITSVPPYSLGFPSTDAQSAYYPGDDIQRDGITDVSRLMEQHKVLPENTRVRKDQSSTGKNVFTVLQASAQQDKADVKTYGSADMQVHLKRGDHCHELFKICEELRLASEHTANEVQKKTLELYIKSFETGDLETYRDGLRSWVRDIGPKVEHIIGFVEPYRDPYGIRSEFEGLVAIADPEETKVLQKLVERSDTFVKRLPWCEACGEENNGKGPFEKSLFEPPDFSSIHVLAYCSSIIFPGINLPNYNDIRQDCGFKNVIIANRMTAESSNLLPSPFVAAAEAETFQKHKFPAYYIWVVLHELLGHGSGKMMCQMADGSFNFDKAKPPTDPLTGKPIEKWYLAGQTWTGQFEDLATTVDECRAELVGAYLMDDKELLKLFGFTDSSEITAEDLTYNTYVQLATDGLRGLANFNVDTKTWGQAHSRAHFATLKCLLCDGAGSVGIDFDAESQILTARIDRARIIPHGKVALAKMLLHLHMYRSTADVASCRAYYEGLSSVEGEYLRWREAVVAAQQPKWVFVQPNTFLEKGGVGLKEYDATPEESIFEDGSSLVHDSDFEFLGDGMDLGDAEEMLLQAALINKDSDERSISVHRLVQTAFIRGLDDTAKRKYFGVAADLLSLGFPDTWSKDVGHQKKEWARCERYLPHVNALVTLASKDPSLAQKPNSWAELLLRCSCYARTFTQAALTSFTNNDTLAYASAIDLLGLIDLDMALPQQALTSFKTGLSIRQFLPQPNDPFIAFALNNLALAYTEIPDLTLAEQHHKQAIALRLANNSDRIGNSYSNYAVTLLRMGKPDEAEQTLMQCPSLQGCTDSTFLEADNPRFVGDMILLSRIRRFQGRTDEALRLASKALAWRQKVHGDRFKTCDSMYDVACFLYDEGQKATALELLDQVSRVAETLEMGEGQGARAEWKVSGMLKEMGREVEAGKKRERAKELRKKARPEEKDMEINNEVAWESLTPHMLW